MLDPCCHPMSISPIFYKQLFHMNIFCAAFMYLQFGFVIFLLKDFGAKAAHKNVGEIDTWWQKLAADVSYVGEIDTWWQKLAAEIS